MIWRVDVRFYGRMASRILVSASWIHVKDRTMLITVLKHFDCFKFIQVQDLHLPIDRATGQRRNFCFVEFESESDADRALNNESHNIAGRDVRVGI